jgi:Cyclic nucleotide-binding domain/HEAT repeats/TLC ATP/ADP transporter
MESARVTRLLGLRPGEGLPVGVATAASFAASAGLMIGQSGIEALFFARYGVQKLPVMYLVLGGTMFLVSLGLGVLLARFGRGGACILIPLVLAVIASAGRLALAGELAWIEPALWLLQGVAYFVVGWSVWGLAGIVSDTRQAKRFFPLIGAGGVLGYVVGGLVTQPLASTIGTENLILVWVATLVLVVILGAKLLSIGDPAHRRPSRDGGVDPVEQLRQGLRYVRRSALMRYMALGAILFSLLFFSLYLPFSRAATTRFPDPDELAGFFGLFFGISTGLAFLLSMFLTNRLLSRFGVPTVMLVLPLLYALAFGVLTIDSSFAALAVFRFAQVAWLSGGASSAWEAVINTVPADRRDQIRAFLYGGPTQVGTVLAGVVALVGERALSPAALSAIGLVGALIATAAMLGVRRAYPRELVQALREGRPSVFDAPPVERDPFGLAAVDASAIEVAVAGLADPDVRVRRVSAHVLGDVEGPEVAAALAEGLHDDDPEVRATAARSLAKVGSEDSVAQILERSTDPEPLVRLAAVEALGALGVQAEAASHAMGPMMHDEDPQVRARSAAVLVRITGDLGAIETLLELAAADDASIRAGAFRAMRGLRTPRLAEAARSGMEDPAAAARAEAARALATLDPDRAFDVLLPALADDSAIVRDAAAAALGHLPVDGRSEILHAFTVERVTDAIEHHRLGAAIDDGDDERLALLKDSLIARSGRDAAAGLRAAAVLDGDGAMSVAIDNLSLGDASQRANALEVIESVGRRDVVRPLISTWDSPPERTDQRSLLERLRHDPDEWIRACADLAAGVDARPAEGASMTRTLATLSPMERVLFLRKVPLFATLPPPDLEPIARIAQEHAYLDGTTIAEQGEPGDAMHIIVSGEVSVIVHADADADAGSGEHVVAVRSSGDVVGEMAVITSEPRMAGLVALGDVRVLSIERRQFESILRERPETSLAVITVLCRRLTESQAPAAEVGSPAGP